MAKRNYLSKLGPLASSAAASTTTVPALGSLFELTQYDLVTVSAKIVGPTGGTLDVYLQRQLEADVWQDWAHFAQVAAGATKFYSLSASMSSTIIEVGYGTTAVPAPLLAANTVVAGHPGEVLRVVLVTGAGVSVAGNATVYILGTNVH